VRPLPLPGTIKPGVTTVILPGTVYTNAGQPIAVVVQCRPLNDFRDKVGLSLGGAWVPMGDIAFCQVRYRANGKVTVRVTYPGPVLVKVTLSAPAKKGYTAYHKVVRYVVRPHR
jgi:hypothetical protein